MDLLRPLLPPNPWLKSMKVNCGRLDDSAIQILLQPSLHELCMLNCDEFTGKLLSEIGGRCKDLRLVSFGSAAYMYCWCFLIVESEKAVVIGFWVYEFPSGLSAWGQWLKIEGWIFSFLIWRSCSEVAMS